MPWALLRQAPELLDALGLLLVVVASLVAAGTWLLCRHEALLRREVDEVADD